MLAKDYRNKQEKWMLRGVHRKCGDVVYQIRVGSDIWVRHANQLKHIKCTDAPSPSSNLLLEQRLGTFHLPKARIIKLTWQDRIPEVPERTGLLSSYIQLKRLQLHCSGHLLRMDDERLPKRLFYGDVAMGSRRQGGQARRYKDTLEASIKQLQINPSNWEDITRNRPAWSRTVKTGAASYEANRSAAARAYRAARKSPAPRCQRVSVR
ncbi:unnamed protein product [Schistocephalus solidus]|uniref:Uncharacterized protein n=1 Tax=Schistocephalus solidus TaxID=70667 RepID=A0A183SPQ8_SCHSO|nr:unnamed protein product [Schistocephalus solidus]